MANETVGTVVGIDVSKNTLDVAISRQGSAAVFGNDDEGHQALVAALRRQPISLVVMEATGHYHFACACALQAAGFQVAVINPDRHVTSPRPWVGWQRPTAWTPRCLPSWPH